MWVTKFMTIEVLLWSGLALVLTLNLIVSIAVALNSPEYLGSQKLYKILFVWLVPIVGAILVWSFRRIDRAETLSTAERKKSREWSAENDSWFHG
ncbi:hypothetical protein [Arenicella xantha]|uniref:Uncharacterized protein n=1 Tax=Arenicella xantha TaxID=644221 RepID=A0A395JIJ1_9GAMM|nr:hypothetical protein [Arenicella xantha]RBP49589.1 hypothetical protein DFR28_10314 [Arenicella xantha]